MNYESNTKKLLQIKFMCQFLQIRQLIDGGWNASDGAAPDTNCGPGDRFNHTLCLERVRHPRVVKLKGTLGNPLVTIAIRVDTGVTTFEQQMTEKMNRCKYESIDHIYIST
jgi:hypothetical protein